MRNTIDGLVLLGVDRVVVLSELVIVQFKPSGSCEESKIVIFGVRQLFRAEHPEIVEVMALIDLNEIIGGRQVFRKLFVCELQIDTLVSEVVLPANVAVIVVLNYAGEPSRFLYT